MKKTDNMTESEKIQKIRLWMMCAFSAVFLIAALLSYYFYTNNLRGHTNKTLRIAIDDTKEAIELGTRDYLLRLTYDVAYNDVGNSLACITNVTEDTLKEMSQDGTLSSADIDAYLEKYCEAFNYREMNIIDENGMVIYTNVPEYYGYDMAADTLANEQAHDFFVHVQEDGYYVQEFRGTSYNVNKRLQYAGIRIDMDCYLCKKGSYLQIGFDSDIIQEDINYRIPMSAANHRVGDSGSIIICLDKPIDGEYTTVGITGVGSHGKSLSAALGGEPFNFDPYANTENTMCDGVIYGIPCHYMYRHIDGYYIVAVIPLAEAHASRDMTIISILGMELISFFVLYLTVYFMIVNTFDPDKDKKKKKNKQDDSFVNPYV